MDKLLPKDWNNILGDELEQSYFVDLMGFVNEAYESTVCFPDLSQVFNAFNKSKLSETRVVILGQDPYHTPGMANGLCFSVNSGVPLPPSLKNIYTEISNDLNCIPPIDGDLSHWAEQGVLLLNATLTVEKGKAGSHQKKGWEKFTDEVIKKISEHKEEVVFLLWGGYARKKKKLIDTSKHLVLESGHPSPLSANRGYWFGNAHFSKCNTYLKETNQQPIKWMLNN